MRPNLRAYQRWCFAFALALLAAYVFRPYAHAAAREYVDLSDYLELGQNAKLMTVAELDGIQEIVAGQFDDVCEDSFCKGDYGNMTLLSLACSVDSASAQVGKCVLWIAGLDIATDEASGDVSGKSKVFSCDLGFKGTATDLVAYLRAEAKETSGKPEDGFTNVKVPGADKSLFEVLKKCL